MRYPETHRNTEWKRVFNTPEGSPDFKFKNEKSFCVISPNGNHELGEHGYFQSAKFTRADEWIEQVFELVPDVAIKLGDLIQRLTAIKEQHGPNLIVGVYDDEWDEYWYLKTVELRNATESEASMLGTDATVGELFVALAPHTEEQIGRVTAMA